MTRRRRRRRRRSCEASPVHVGSSLLCRCKHGPSSSGPASEKLKKKEKGKD